MSARVIASGLTSDRTFAFPDANGTIVVAGSSPTFVSLTLSAVSGVLYKGASRFLHNYADATSDGFNTFLGVLAGNLTLGPGGGASSLASYNVAVGDRALEALTTGSHNTALGMDTLRANTTGSENSGLGESSLVLNTTGTGNTAGGQNSLHNNTSGGPNTAYGVSSAYSNTVGINNTALGYQALYSNVDGGSNVAVGLNALFNVQHASENTAVGENALFTSTGGAGNVALGRAAGYWETGNNKLFIDNTARSNEADARVKALIYGVFDAAVANQIVTINGALAAVSVRGVAVAFASLPTPIEGMLVAVTNSTTAVWGATITGGGANHVLAYYNGTNWTVAGK